MTDTGVPDYPLPDQILIDPDAATNSYLVWQPNQAMIVLGQSNRVETAVDTDLAERDGIPVYKRYSGGQTVILSPQTLVISVRLISDKPEHPQVYFKYINGMIIKALINIGITNPMEKGISDLAIGEKKILGSSIYRKRSMVFYHAVLNVAETPEFIGRYLKHPVREPDYRIGRKHEDFVTSIHQAGYPFPISCIKEAIEQMLSLNIQIVL